MIPITSIGPSGIGGYCQTEMPADVQVRSSVEGGVWKMHITMEGPSICEAVASDARRSTAYFEGFCFGVGIGMVVLAVLGWLVS